jgi:hypothetical protein
VTAGEPRDRPRASSPAVPTTFDTGRLLARSDGVYAISLTLLVLSLEIPADVSGATLRGALGDLVPQLFAYDLTVAVLGIFWLAHHRLFSAVERVDSATLAVNIAYLALVALLPHQRAGSLRRRAVGGREALGPVPLPVGLVFLASVPVAWWNPAVALWLWLVAIPWSILAGRLTTRRRTSAPPRGAAGAR